VPPKKHKTGNFQDVAGLYATVPGLGVLERMYDGVDGAVFCIKDRTGRYLAVNDAFLRRARVVDKTQLIGRTAREVFPALLAAGYEEQDEKVFRSGHEIRDQLEMVTNPDGSFGWYLARKIPVRDATGRIVAVAGVSRDLNTAGDHPRISRLAKSLEHLRENFASPVSIARLAKGAGMSLSGFLRLTQSVLGVSPRSLLTKLRVEEAARQLAETKLPLSRIALECGFCDQPTFCRQFKSVTGTTPMAYRRLKNVP
jgi:PAS domain S-box-containing protein